MASQDIAAAIQHVESMLRTEPDTGLGDDAPATARWRGGLRVHLHANGMEVVTDMPVQLGGTGDKYRQVGWYARAPLHALHPGSR